MKLAVTLAFASAALGQQASLPWNLRETAMTADGRLTFVQKTWWPRAQALKEGERFTLDLNSDGRPDTIVTRQQGHIVQAIDDTGRASGIWNKASTTYVVSFKGAGPVDRLISYIDNDGDGKADELDMRHFQDGYLRYSWFGENYDGDGLEMLEVKDWSYAGNNGRNKLRGNMTIYLNKYDSKAGRWSPLSECPFSFWDHDGDGHGDVVLRVSAAPIEALTGSDPDYANNYKYMWSPLTASHEQTGIVNIRLSYNLDGDRQGTPVDRPHYTFGFTMTGSAPYDYAKAAYTNPRRRPPQTAYRIPWKDGLDAAFRFPARETAFSWDESHSVWRWEGQFWTYERIYLSNTGGPTERWNMRREYAARPSSSRQIYYSAADRRFHLKGATEAWLEVGHLVNKSKDLEFRWFDRDGDGYLDECQVFRGDEVTPVRISRFSPRSTDVPLERGALVRDYERAVAEAIEDNRKLIAALKPFGEAALAAAYEAEAGRSTWPDRRRYCLDIARELYYLNARDALAARLRANPYPSSALNRKRAQSMEPGSREEGYTMGDSVRYWTLSNQLDALAAAYGDGRSAEVIRLLEAIQP